ncbi:MAG: fructosamine kinase family protein [Pseudomonadota bacterium]
MKFDCESALSAWVGSPVSLSHIAGGDTHTAYRCQTNRGEDYFVKACDRRRRAILRSEYESLIEINKLDATLPYPKVIALLEEEQISLLVLEYWHLASLSEGDGARLAKALDRQYSTSSARFGWHKHNYIGSTPQLNDWTDSWADFFVEQRLGMQLDLAVSHGLSSTLAQGMHRRLAYARDLLVEHTPQPSLVHGDLWIGNVALRSDTGQIGLFDPAPYFGDPEVDLAMTELFGGFPNSLGYIWFAQKSGSQATKEGYERRRTIYNAYHALNHFNLFGAAYEGMVNACLSD